MPPTRYQGYRDPYAGSIADIILRRGDIAARGAENIGQIQARAAETRGNAWANAAGSIGDLARGIPLQIERQREQAAVNRERQARTTAVEQRTTREANAEKFAQEGEAFIQQALQESRTADGDPDFDAVAKKLELSPFREAADGFRAKAEKNRKGLAEAKALAETVAAKTAELQARIVAEATDPDDFASDIGFYISAGRIDPETAATTIKAARSAPDWKAFQQEIIAASPEFQAQQLKTREIEANIAYKEAQTADLNEPPELKAPEPFTLNPGAVRFGPDGKPIASVPRAPEGRVTPNAALESTLRLRDRFVRETQSAQAVKTQYDLMKASLEAVKKGAAAPGSQGVLVTFQKILDPASVVRESEYARSASGLSLLTRLEGQWMKIKEGGAGVPVEELQKFVDLSERFVRNQARAAQVTKDQIDGIAREFGLKPENITRELGIIEDADGWIDLGNGIRAREKQP